MIIKELLFFKLNPFRSSHRRYFIEKSVLKNFATFTGKHLCWSLSFNKGLKKETPTQLFSCEYCKMIKSTYFEEHLQTDASVLPSKYNRAESPLLYEFNVNFLELYRTISELKDTVKFQIQSDKSWRCKYGVSNSCGNSRPEVLC